MKRKITLMVVLVNICSLLLTGCWSYREIEDLAIVSGVAIDKKENGKLLITVEIISSDHGQQQSALKPLYLQIAGDSFFDAVRKMITIQGKKLYWSHAKVIIVSEDIAKSGISHYLDFLNRDVEVREDMWILLSREKTAYKIFDVKPQTESIISLEIDSAMREQASISRYPDVEFYQILDELANPNTATTLPTIEVIDSVGIPTIHISGAGIIKENKLAGFLDDYEAKSLLWIRDELKGGLFVVKNPGKDKSTVTLEIFKSRTKLQPEIVNGMLLMNVRVQVDVNVGGVIGDEDYISLSGRSKLKQESEKQIKKNLELLIEKVQKEYKADVFGFGQKIRRTMPQVWKSIEKDWDKYFCDMKANIEVNVNIQGSGIINKPTKVVE